MGLKLKCYKICLLVFYVIILSADGLAQNFSKSIEDNSFFLEEAYNQEDGIVQHIINTVTSEPKIIEFSFTQEWPFLSQLHQLSYTINYASLNSNNISGFGDILLNYRYQLFDKQDWAAAAPNITLIIPAGDEEKGLSSGSTGFEFAFPVSKRISNNWVLHFNAGISIVPGVKFTSSSGDITKTLSGYIAGFSIIWMPIYELNFMLETMVDYSNAFSNSGNLEYETEKIISPGIRYALDIGSLQIIPGAAFYFLFNSGDTETGAFLYLSFEHPF